MFRQEFINGEVFLFFLEYKLSHNLTKQFTLLGKESMTKYGMVQTIANVFQLPMKHINPDPNPSQGASRPHNAQLSNAKLENLNIGKHTPFAEGIKSTLEEWVKRHSAGELN